MLFPFERDSHLKNANQSRREELDITFDNICKSFRLCIPLNDLSHSNTLFVMFLACCIKMLPSFSSSKDNHSQIISS